MTREGSIQQASKLNKASKLNNISKLNIASKLHNKSKSNFKFRLKPDKKPLHASKNKVC